MWGQVFIHMSLKLDIWTSGCTGMWVSTLAVQVKIAIDMPHQWKILLGAKYCKTQWHLPLRHVLDSLQHFMSACNQPLWLPSGGLQVHCPMCRLSLTPDKRRLPYISVSYGQGLMTVVAYVYRILVLRYHRSPSFVQMMALRGENQACQCCGETSLFLTSWHGESCICIWFNWPL